MSCSNLFDLLGEVPIKRRVPLVLAYRLAFPPFIISALPLSTLPFVTVCHNIKDIDLNTLTNETPNQSTQLDQSLPQTWRPLVQTRPSRCPSSHTTSPHPRSSLMASRPAARLLPTSIRSSLTLLSPRRSLERPCGQERTSSTIPRSGHIVSLPRRCRS